jgi:DNA mismatch endonuclease (patch repair protein)
MTNYMPSMADIVDRDTRSRMMSGIRRANTKPEILLRKALHAQGFRFRVNVKSLPGTPDIVLPKWRTVIQVHGCYWHRHEDCPKAVTPSSNVEFWTEKFAANVRRDAKVLAELQSAGWRTAIVWECQIGRVVPTGLVQEIANFIRDDTTGHREFEMQVL